MKLNEKIITLRNMNQMSQGDLAEKLNVSRQSVSKWETGASVPDLDKLIAMSELFQVTMDELTKENVEIGEVQNRTAPEEAKDVSEADVLKEKKKVRVQRIIGVCLIFISCVQFLFFSLGRLPSLGGLFVPIYLTMGGMICVLCKKNPVKKILIVTTTATVIYILVCWIDYLARL